jgi:tRNA G18 (ribose-2'-O)-methylase SpoU
MASKKSEAILILPNIRSTYNVGAIFRTADAAGVSKIYLVGITPTPVDKFGRVRADVAKSALGAEQTVSWESVKTLAPLVRRLKKEGFTVVAVEQDARAVHYTKVHRTEKMSFV